MSNKNAPKKPAAKEPKAANPTAPEEVIVPPESALEEASVEAPAELMQTAGGNVKEDERPMAVIAANLASKLDDNGGKTVFATKSKDQAIEILANGKSYKPYGKEGVFIWEVTEEDVDMFSMHSHVQHGKIVKAAGK